MLLLKWFSLLLIVLLTTGFGYEQFSRWRLERSIRKNRTFAHVNSKPLHYVKKGNGNATVVFVSGMGSGHVIWQELQDSLALHATTLSYDRNGILFSPANGDMLSNETVSQELEALLEQTKCPKPYILVMHSMAGIYMRPFIARHLHDIKGLVFAEAAHPHQLREASDELLKSRFIPPKWLVNFVVNLGIYRTFFSFFPVSNEIPMDHRLQHAERNFFCKSYRRLLKEVESEQQNFDDASRHGDFGNTPLIIIAGTSESRYKNIKDQTIKTEYCQLMEKLSKDFLQLSKKSELITTEKSGHILQVNDNELLCNVIKTLF